MTEDLLGKILGQDVRSVQFGRNPDELDGAGLADATQEVVPNVNVFAFLRHNTIVSQEKSGLVINKQSGIVCGQIKLSEKCVKRQRFTRG